MGPLQVQHSGNSGRRYHKGDFANMDINEQKLTELKEEQQKKLYVEAQNIIKGLSAFYHSVFYVDLAEETFRPLLCGKMSQSA